MTTLEIEAWLLIYAGKYESLVRRRRVRNQTCLHGCRKSCRDKRKSLPNRRAAIPSPCPPRTQARRGNTNRVPSVTTLAERCRETLDNTSDRCKHPCCDARKRSNHR